MQFSWNSDSLNTGPSPPASCGKSPVTRVIGGVDAKPGNWPWQVSTNFHVENNVEYTSLVDSVEDNLT